MKTLEDLGYTRSNAKSDAWFYGGEVYFKYEKSGMFPVYIIINRKNSVANKTTCLDTSGYFTLDELKAVTALLEDNHD